MMPISHPFKRTVLPLSTTLSSRQPMKWRPWLCTCRPVYFSNTSDLPRHKALVGALPTFLVIFSRLRHAQASTSTGVMIKKQPPYTLELLLTTLERSSKHCAVSVGRHRECNKPNCIFLLLLLAYNSTHKGMFALPSRGGGVGVGAGWA